MFDTQSHFQIDNENNLISLDVFKSENFASFVLLISNIFMISGILIVFFLLGTFNSIQKVSFYIGKYIWNFLTPGNEILEITALVSSLIICGTVFCFIYDVIDKIETKIIKLKEDSKRKAKIIEQMDYEIAKLKSYIIKNNLNYSEKNYKNL